jgi:hypothetical protein
LAGVSGALVFVESLLAIIGRGVMSALKEPRLGRDSSLLQKGGAVASGALGGLSALAEPPKDKGGQAAHGTRSDSTPLFSTFD